MAVQGIGWRMVLRITVVAALLALVSCGSGNSGTKTETVEVNLEPMNTEEARDVFTLQCASCHGMDGKLKSSNAADLSISKMDDKTIKTTILNGNDKGMMPYKDILSMRETDGLVEYVKNLRK